MSPIPKSLRIVLLLVHLLTFRLRVFMAGIFLPFYFLFLEHYFYFVFGKCTYYKTIRERYLFMRNISKSFTRQRVRRWRDQLHPRSRWAVRKGYVQGVGEARILDGTSLLYTWDDRNQRKVQKFAKERSDESTNTLKNWKGDKQQWGNKNTTLWNTIHSPSCC